LQDPEFATQTKVLNQVAEQFMRAVTDAGLKFAAAENTLWARGRFGEEPKGDTVGFAGASSAIKYFVSRRLPEAPEFARAALTTFCPVSAPFMAKTAMPPVLRAGFCATVHRGNH
jgi:hypothetical protein